MVSAKRELAEVLSDIALFSRCTAGARRSIARHAQMVQMPAGAELVHEGEPGDAMFVLLEGDAVVRKGDVEVNRVGPGSYFGELAILDGAPRAASVVAVTDVRVAVIGIRMFRTLLREYSDLAEQLLVGLAGELRDARRALDGR